MPNGFISRRHFENCISASCPFSLHVDLNTVFKCPYDPSGCLDPYANQHIGQRKLLMAEVQFLTHYYRHEAHDPVVVYAGAAPGHHLTMLSDMFPHVRFILYDTIDFSSSLHNPCTQHMSFEENLTNVRSRFDIRKKAFDLDECASIHDSIKDAPLLFISDIRLISCSRESFERQVAHDMEMQLEWMRALRPRMSLVKFRLPYTLQHGEKYLYVPGHLMFGIWPKAMSGETRLVIDGKHIDTTVEYDFKAYEETLAFHNQCKRSASFLEYIRHSRPQFMKLIQRHDNIYCPCFDCTAELETYQTYLDTVVSDSASFSPPFKSLDDIINAYATMFTKGKPEFPRSRDRFRSRTKC